MSRRGVESKPAWRWVPPAVRAEAERLLGARVARAERVYGGYVPSATFRVRLADGRGAFFKGTYPLPAGSAVRWVLDREERVYRTCASLMRPWAPAFYGSVRRDGWHALLLEDLGPVTVPPWTARKANLAARSYAEFHASTLSRSKPRWLPRDQHRDFASFWSRLARAGELARTAGLAGRRSAEARDWLARAVPRLRRASERLRRLRGTWAFLHFDTRSDNIRLHGPLLRVFDWPFASVGPAEFDLAAFAQSVAAEGGPAPEVVLASYAEVLPLREAALDASVAAVAGYFADRAWRPPLAGLPRLRSIQRRQLKAALAWAARRLELPEPQWLTVVRD